MEGNLEIREKEGYVWVSVNPKIYHLDVIYSAAYMFLETCYVMIDGDPMEEVIVELRSKNKTEPTDLRTLGREFNNELINYANYAVQCIRNAGIRETILKRVLLTQDAESAKNTSAPETVHLDENAEPRKEAVGNPLEEKYGKNKSEQGKK